MSKGKSGGGKGRGGGRTPMTQQAASRIQSRSAKDSSSRSATTGFGSRAQSAGDRNSKGDGQQ